MAQKDEVLKNENNETKVNSDDKPLERRKVEELQEEFSSIFNEDYDESEEAEELEGMSDGFPLLPFLGRKERYGRNPYYTKEKKNKKKKRSWGKKAQEKAENPEEKTEDVKTSDNKIEETAESKNSVLPLNNDSEKEVVEKDESAKENVKTEIGEEKETEEIVSVEITDEKPETEENQEEFVEIVLPFEEEQPEETVEIVLPFEEEQPEETVEVVSPFEEEQPEETVEVVSPFEEEQPEETVEIVLPFEEEQSEETFVELPPFENVKTERAVETVVVETTKEEVKTAKKKKVKEKKEKEEIVQETVPEPLTKKDHFTFILALVALVLAIAFVCVKFFPINDNNNEQTPENKVETSAKLSEIQVVRQGVDSKYIQSDLKNVYYSISSEDEVKYYECENNAMKPLQVTGTVNAQVAMDKNNIPVAINYVKTGEGVFGITVFRSEDNPGSTVHNVITFKLINLPEKYSAEGKALLLAVANSESVTRRYNLWSDSFIVDLNTGATTRFLTVDKKSSSYSVAYSVLTNSAHATDGEMIPFFTTRQYDDGSGKKDLFVKNGTNEALFATDVYGEYIYADKDVIAYLKMTATGFDVVKKEDTKEEKKVFSLYGSFSTDYLYHQEYILNKLNGNLYNVKTGDEIALAGYKMSSAEMMSVSPDGRYLVVIGTVNSVADYQVHIFDLKKNDYAKYSDMNFSQHYNLAFVDNTKVMYVTDDPNQGYEQVILDASKAF